MIGFVYSIAGDLVISALAGILAVRLYHAIGARQLIPNR